MKKLIQILGSTITVYFFVVVFGAFLTLKCQQNDPNANIKNYYDSLWWSVNATSIGDSNVYPITIEGRLIGFVLIVVGYGLFTVNVGVISASLNHMLSINKLKVLEDKINIFIKK